MENNIPVLAFTTIYWNQLQSDPPSTMMMMMDGFCPTTLECLEFALHHPAVEVVLHFTRDEEALDKAFLPSLSSLATSKRTSWLSEEKCKQWHVYGSDKVRCNEDGVFDEYPEESI